MAKINKITHNFKCSSIFKLFVILVATTLLSACSDDEGGDDGKSTLSPTKKTENNNSNNNNDNNDNNGNGTPTPGQTNACPDAFNPPQMPKQPTRAYCLSPQEAKQNGFRVYPVNINDKHIPNTVDQVLQFIPLGTYQGHLEYTQNSCTLTVQSYTGTDKNFLITLSLPKTTEYAATKFAFELRRCSPYKLSSFSGVGNTLMLSTHKTMIRGQYVSSCEKHLIAEFTPATKLKHVYIYSSEVAAKEPRPHVKCIIDKKIN